MDIYYLWPADTHRTAVDRACLCHRGGTHSLQLQANVRVAAARLRARSREVHACLHHGLGLLLLLAVAHHLGRQSSRRNQLVHAPSVWRMGIRRTVPGGVSIRSTVRAVALTPVQT